MRAAHVMRQNLGELKLLHLLTHIRCDKKVRFEPGSARFKDFEPCLNPEPNLWSGSTHPPEPWTELWSGSEKFRFELWFGTGLRHPYHQP
jgi:hypothetical protein